MLVTALRLASVRAIQDAELRFGAGVNLVVGVNGVGKTTVLDALSVCLSKVVNRANGVHARPRGFSVGDIHTGAAVLSVECDLWIGDRRHTSVFARRRTDAAAGDVEESMSRQEVLDTSSVPRFTVRSLVRVTGDEPGGRPIAVLYSTQRAVPSERVPRRAAAAGDWSAAFAGAVNSRKLRLGEFADWMRVQQELSGDHPASQRLLAACEAAVRRFLPGYANLRLVYDDRPRLWIDRGDMAVPLRQLSDGERGILALVLDLTRRLAQANPHLADPAAESEAVVLIDELELHLHPKWQRQIVHNLTAAFPLCQFIATTHSPQIIGEVPPDRIQIMAEGEVFSPPRSLGVDSSGILEEVMDASRRTREVADLLSIVSQAFGRQQFDRVRELLDRLVGILGENDPEVTRLRTMLSFLEGDE